MTQGFGFVERRFAPELPQFEVDSFKLIIELCCFRKPSLPAPVEDPRYKAAVWLGYTANLHGESPVLAASLLKQHQLKMESKAWYVGIENLGFYDGKFQKSGSQPELAYLAINSAEYGPFNFYSAVANLKSLYLV